MLIEKFLYKINYSLISKKFYNPEKYPIENIKCRYIKCLNILNTKFLYKINYSLYFYVKFRNIL